MTTLRKISLHLVLSAIATAGICNVHGQSRLPEYESEWQIKVGAGANFSATSPLMPASNFAESLIVYDDNNFEWGVTVSYFFHKRWGLEAGYQTFTPKDPMKLIPERFSQGIVDEYSAGYYIVDNTATHNRSSGRGYFGLVFRVEKGRVLFYPKLRLGWYVTGVNSGNATLKEKGSNQMLGIDYARKVNAITSFSFSPAVTIGCKLTSRLYFTVDLEADYFKSNLRLDRTTTDLAWGDVRTDEILYLKKDVVRLSVNAGLTAVVGKRKEFRRAKPQDPSARSFDSLD